VNIGIVGIGYWGPNIVRNLHADSSVSAIYVFDLNKGRLQKIKSKFPALIPVRNFDALLDNNIEAIIIATPVYSHFELAKKALENGKHIWVEKPFVMKVQEAEELINISEKNGLKIFVDHTFIYTGAVRKIKDLVEKNELGKIKYFDSVRINLGIFQHDINVLWDLAPHDLSILNYILPQFKVEAVSVNGIANYSKLENIAQICLYLSNGCFANLHLNWTSPVKARRIIVGGDKKMLVFDDLENFEKIKVFDSGVDFTTAEKLHEALVQYRIGDMYSPKILQTEALSLAVKEFISSIIENRIPLTNGYDGLKIVRILEESQKSIEAKGKLIQINNWN
jgi:predicted dehydrogenase